MKIADYLRKAQFYETDQMAIIHHANYIHWMEEARVDFMKQMGYGYERSTAEGIDFAVTGLTCEYKSMVRFGETVRIHMSISKLTPSHMSIKYEMYDLQTDALRNIAESHHCYINRHTGRPVSLKKVLPELYSLFENFSS